ncbi:MAG: polyphosphate kinase 1, partial [Planctomycetaceae bacterium]
PGQEDSQPRFAVIPCGQIISRFVTLPSDGGYEYTLLEDVIHMHIEHFFWGETVVDCASFRILRDADMSVADDLASDLLSEIQDVLDARKHSACVRLEISDSASPSLLNYLTQSLGIESTDVYPSPGPLDLSAFMQLTELSGYEFLQYPDWPPAITPNYDPSHSIFDTISRQDLVLCHPYESFDPVVRFVEEAADDPDVLAIKQTLYRTSRNSPIVAALRRAAESGKYVTAIIELKARFDEARNIAWAKDLEQAGVQVVYGVKSLKTHAKICIVVRREPQGLQRYLHFGTGNYNEVTAQIYTDVSLMTCNPELGADAISFFNAVTGYSQPQQFLCLSAAPINLRDRLLEMIQVETECCRNGHPGRIKAKLNALVAPTLIEALYEASQAGVDIELNVRGICCLRPGVPGLSERIRVVSIVDRFLEHSRLVYFFHGGDERVFLSSSDWMPRNLDRRVELLVPVEDPDCRRRLIDILDTSLHDPMKSRERLADGRYQPPSPSNQQPNRSQQTLYTQAQLTQQRSTQRRRTVFEPHRAPGSLND